MTRLVLLICVVMASNTFAEEQRTRAALSLDHGYRYQGMHQTEHGASWRASMHHHLTDEIVAGIWAGQYELSDYRKSNEVDYFIGYSRQLSFTNRVDLSLWHYTFSEETLDNREWTQLLASWHRDERMTITLGLADNLLATDDIATLIEATYRFSSGPLTTSFVVGRNDIPEPHDAFVYAQAIVSYSFENWQVFGSYTDTAEIDNPLTRLYSKEGAGIGISYTF